MLAQFKNEAMAMEEWIEHYFWQGADMLILLDNNSTDGGGDLARKHKNVIVIDAPKKHAQEENYFTLGYACAIKHDVDALAVLDLDEFMFGQNGRPFKEHVEEHFSQGYSQISVHWTMFGSSGFELQPKSIRKSFVWRKKDLQSNLKSIWKVKDLIQLFTHKSLVRGPTLELLDGLQLNHYKIQSKEFYSKVKIQRGDATSIKWNLKRNWKNFQDSDYHDIQDTLLLDLLEQRVSSPIPSKIEPYWGILEHNPFDWKDKISYLMVSLPISVFILCFLKDLGLRIFTVFLVVNATIFAQKTFLSGKNSRDSIQIQQNRKFGCICFTILTLLSFLRS